MATFATGDQSLNAALGNLATAMFPDPSARMTAIYRAAAANNAAADADKARIEAQLLQEQAARSQAAAGPLADLLVQNLVGDEPGVSPDIAGPPTAGVSTRVNAIRATLPAILAREGNPAQLAQGLGSASGLAAILAGPQDEASQRQAFGLLTNTTPTFAEGQAITPETQRQLLDDIQAASAIEAAQTAQAREAAKSAYGTGAQPTLYQYRTPQGALGTTIDGKVDVQTGAPIPPNSTLLRPAQVQGTSGEVLGEPVPPVVRAVQDQQLAISEVVSGVSEVAQLVQTDPQVVGFLGDAIRFMSGVTGQLITAGEELTGQELQARADALQQELMQTDEPTSRFQALMLGLAVRMARADEPGGRLSDQDIKRALDQVSVGPTGSADQVLAKLDEVDKRVRRTFKRNTDMLQASNILGLQLPPSPFSPGGRDAGGGAGTPDDPYTGLTREQYNALPAGAHYRDAQGNVYRKN